MSLQEKLQSEQHLLCTPTEALHRDHRWVCLVKFRKHVSFRQILVLFESERAVAGEEDTKVLRPTIGGFDMIEPRRNKLHETDQPEHDEDPEARRFDDIRDDLVDNATSNGEGNHGK